MSKDGDVGLSDVLQELQLMNREIRRTSVNISWLLYLAALGAVVSIAVSFWAGLR